jgi:hypothetical protein
MTDSNCPKLRKSHGSLRSKPEKKLGDEDQSLVKGCGGVDKFRYTAEYSQPGYREGAPANGWETN